MMEFFGILWDNFGLWCMISILVFILWGIMMGDPGSSDIGNLIITIICGIIALPISVFIAIIILFLHFSLKNRTNDN
jgi:hypothetical protein